MTAMDKTSRKKERSSSPGLRRSSASGSDDTERPTSNQSQPTPKSSQIYAFLNHSTETVSDNLPPTVDDKPLARQRRRRTSPEDQAILESAYARNSKPDKAARTELTQQVSLGEKEVQIWFQNRRQSSRRKSRPLLPHEIAQFQLYRSGGVPHTSSSEALNVSFDEDGTVYLTPNAQSSNIRASANYPLTGDGAPRNVSDSSDISVGTVDASRQAAGPGYPNLSNDGALGAMYSSHAHPVSPNILRAGPERSTKRSSSFMRLSMNSEGNATVVTKDSTSPSPPRPQQGTELVSVSKTASSHAHPVASDAGPIVSTLPPLKRSASGRSRDSRAWEFWCDKDARGELEDKAEKDASGSAVNAIGLLRSTSGRRVLGAISSKRNSLMSQHSTSTKRPKLDGHVPSLQKASTSNARLQNDRNATHLPKLKPALQSTSTYHPGDESDKENWSPDGQQLHQQRAERGGGGENDNPEADPEIESFMRSGRKSSSVSGVEEMDCIQGLLSLSQGNWR